MKQKNKKRLLFITGSRGEWGYIRPILRLIEDHDNFDYSLCVTNMHLLPSFGSPIKEIESDGFKIDYRIHMAIDGHTHHSMLKSLGIFLSSLADILSSERFDWIILAGDRGEQLMGAVSGAFCYIPVAHIQAGELSGNIDGMTRHAIGKFAHLHLAANSDAENRLLKLGEESFRVHNVGAPQLDELVKGLASTIDEVEKNLSISLIDPFILVVQHAATEEAHYAGKQISVTLDALKNFKINKIVILPNNDAGSVLIKNKIEELKTSDFQCFANLSRTDYLCLLKNCLAIVGNSSSGLLEAPTYNTPAVNIGRRQNCRVSGMNVIHCPFETQKAIDAIEVAISPKFKQKCIDECVNPYGDGKSSERILNLIDKIRIDENLLTKNLTF